MITIKKETGVGGKFLNTDLDAYLRGISAFATLGVKNPIVPATEGNSAAAVNAEIIANAKFVQTVTIELRNEDDEVLTAFNGSVGPVGVLSIADTSAAGAAAIDPASVNADDKPIFVNGVATVLINYTGTFAGAETVTLTLTNTVMTEANGGDTVTFVDTLIA